MRIRHFVLALFTFVSLTLYPCTNFIVTKGASTDGSTMVTYTADSYTFYGTLYHSLPGVYPEGTMVKIYEWDTGKYLGSIKQASQIYNVIGNMNEFQVVIGETTFGGREELVDPKGVMDYGSLIYIALQRSKTAREAIKIMTDLVEEYGYYSSGESFSIADPNEAWIMEMIGKGPNNKGAVWVAVRIPDGYVSGHANQARITQFPLNDPENCLYAKDVISFARQKGYFDGKDADFSFSDAYAPLDFGAVRFCDARVWSLFRRCNSSMDKYISYIQGENLDRMPLYIKPDKKLSVHDVMVLMRDHYEGTPLDMTKGIAAGPYGSPYRWRPLTWSADGNEYFNERPISTPQTGFSFISQSRAHLPREIGGLLWFGLDDTYMTVYVPMYTNMTRIPKQYAAGTGSMTQFTWESAFWIFNFVANYAYPKYSLIMPDIQQVQNELEGKFLSRQADIEQAATALLKNSRGEAVEYLTEYSNSMAQYTLTRWKSLGEFLVMKYNDGILKDEFGRPKNPGYPEAFRKQMAAEAGDALKMRELPIPMADRFREAMLKGDRELEAGNYAEAKKAYEAAQKINPNVDSVANKIETLNNLINELDQVKSKYFPKK